MHNHKHFFIRRQLKSEGGPGFAQTVTVFVPMLRKAGVDDKTIQQIVVQNPRRWLAFIPKADA